MSHYFYAYLVLHSENKHGDIKYAMAQLLLLLENVNLICCSALALYPCFQLDLIC